MTSPKKVNSYLCSHELFISKLQQFWLKSRTFDLTYSSNKVQCLKIMINLNIIVQISINIRHCFRMLQNLSVVKQTFILFAKSE